MDVRLVYLLLKPLYLPLRFVVLLWESLLVELDQLVAESVYVPAKTALARTHVLKVVNVFEQDIIAIQSLVREEVAVLLV